MAWGAALTQAIRGGVNFGKYVAHRASGRLAAVKQQRMTNAAWRAKEADTAMKAGGKSPFKNVSDQQFQERYKAGQYKAPKYQPSAFEKTAKVAETGMYGSMAIPVVSSAPYEMEAGQRLGMY